MTAYNIKTDIAQLAESVLHKDSLQVRANSEQMAHILEIALKTVIGFNCLGYRSMDIDLGNGHYLHCTLGKELSTEEQNKAFNDLHVKGSA